MAARSIFLFVASMLKQSRTIALVSQKQISATNLIAQPSLPPVSRPWTENKPFSQHALIPLMEMKINSYIQGAVFQNTSRADPEDITHGLDLLSCSFRRSIVSKKCRQRLKYSSPRCREFETCRTLKHQTDFQMT